VLLTGDHILPTITPNVSIHTQTHGSPLGDYMRSLEKLEDLDVEYVLPAHEFDTKELKKRIREIEHHHEERLDEMMRCVDSGGSTAWEVAGRVQWATGMLKDFEPFMQRAAVGETLAHLEYLFEVGRLAKVMREKSLVWLRV
jgi:glyoxylase-like metal-dependent hydrolase (beta-lactamase superfamily II)